MKNALTGLASLFAVGAVSAQSSVTVFGLLDASISRYEAKTDRAQGGRVTQSQWALGSSSSLPSRLGFRGTEDLGGGLAVGFWLETAVGNDSGTVGSASSFFNRRSTISLSGGFGEIRLGRDYKPSFWSNNIFDPFYVAGVGGNLIQSLGTTLEPDVTRSSNSIGYFLPRDLGGFYGQLQYAFHEKTKETTTSPTAALNAQDKDGAYYGMRFGYANGPLDVALAYGQSTVETKNAPFGNVGRKVKTANLGFSYDFGVARLLGEYARIRDAEDAAFPAEATSETWNGFLIGLSVPVDAGVINAAYSRVKSDDENAFLPAPRAGKLALGYTYYLSKRTALYATVAHVSNKHGAAFRTGGSAGFLATTGSIPRSASGYDFGIRHAF